MIQFSPFLTLYPPFDVAKFTNFSEKEPENIPDEEHSSHVIFSIEKLVKQKAQAWNIGEASHRFARTLLAQ
jgi:hypothetical protein